MTATNTAAPTPGTGIRVPDDLSELDQWVLWCSEQRGGKSTKVPYQLNGSRAKSDDPRTWNTYEAVIAAWTEAPQRYSGVGFVFSESDPFVGIDLDNCLDAGGAVKPWAAPIIETFADTYTEISPSGRGVKIWAKARLDGPGKRTPYQDGAIEIYDRGRFFTVTGRVLNSSPRQVEEHQSDGDTWVMHTISARALRALAPGRLMPVVFE